MGWRWLPSPLGKGGSQRSLWIFPYVLCVFVYLCLYICGHKCEHVSTCTNLIFHVSGPRSPLTLFQSLDSLEMREPGSTQLVFCRSVGLWKSQVGQAVHFAPGSVSSVKLWWGGRRWQWGEESQESQRLSCLSCGECKCCLPGTKMLETESADPEATMQLPSRRTPRPYFNFKDSTGKPFLQIKGKVVLFPSFASVSLPVFFFF